MKKETLQKANKLDEAIVGIENILYDIKRGEPVKINGKNTVLYRSELQEFLVQQKARLEAEFERLV